MQGNGASRDGGTMKRSRRLLGTIALAVASAIAAPLLRASPATAAPASGYPKLVLTDAASGKPFDMSTLAAANKATLLWFWAPH